MADLVTRCPSCRTAFRVVQDQLRLRDGRVRCGVCHHVFDARAEEVAFDPRDLGAGVERQRVPAPTVAPAFTPTPAASTRPANPPGSNGSAAPGRRAEPPEAPRDDAWPRAGMRPEPGQLTPPPGQGLPPFVARRPEPHALVARSARRTRAAAPPCRRSS
ncbi:zinc-ribbon domain-containing protein, partial [Achromobacter sp. GG226]|uniref:MJ0042-type zinc finger domain-containing protein n=1 Tax=Verticiella alkaliphila TaxID=2779529 RepID=UPI001C0AF5F8